MEREKPEPRGISALKAKTGVLQMHHEMILQDFFCHDTDSPECHAVCSHTCLQQWYHVQRQVGYSILFLEIRCMYHIRHGQEMSVFGNTFFQ